MHAAGLSFIAWSRRPNSPRRNAIDEPREQHEHGGDGDEVRLVARDRAPPGERLAVGREARDLAQHVLLDHQRERHRAECEVEVAQSQARNGDHRADQTREAGGDEQAHGRRTELARQPRRGQHAQSGERELSQRDLTGVPDQQHERQHHDREREALAGGAQHARRA